MLQVDQKLRDLIPPLSPQERDALEASIVEHGCRDGIVVWAGRNIIVDGHNRHEICERLGLPYSVKEVQFEDEPDVIEFMCITQLGRRNLSDIAQADLRGKRYNNEKNRHGGDRKSRGHCDPLIQGKTSDRIAEETGVSSKTVKRDAALSDALDAIADAGIARSEFTDGQRKVDRGSILKLGKAAKESVEDAKVAWQKVTDKSRPGHLSIKTALREVRDEKVVVSITKRADDLVKVHHGDFYEMSADIQDESIDAIITDPPYPQEFLHTWAQMAEVGMRVLKPGGWCIAYSGKMHLDEVIVMMRDAGLRFYWQIMFRQTVQAVVHPRKVNTRYKPILVFQKPPVTPQEAYIADVFDGEGVQKDRHEWQQSEGGFEFLIENFTKPGDTILEPFAGGGTCPAVAKRMSRYCIAYEIDEKSHAQTCDRLWGTAA
jgi:DNA methylase